MNKFFIGLEDRLLIVDETLDGFDVKERLVKTQPTRLAVDPENGNLIYCGTHGDGLWRSEDGGGHWDRLGAQNFTSAANKMGGLSSSKITSMAVHPLRKAEGHYVIYAGTEPSRLFYSEDEGKSWREFTGIQNLPSKANWSFPPRPYTHFVRWITPSYANENHLAISIEAGAVLNTDDHGKTWRDRSAKSPIDVHTLLAHPQAPGRLYAANGDGVADVQRAYAESHDEGRTWQYMGEGLQSHPYLYNMVLHPDNPDDRLVSASKNASAAHGSKRYSTVYRKLEDASWQEISEGLPRRQAYTHHLANDPKEKGAYFALNNFGIYHLGKKMARWEKINIDWQAYEGKRPYFLGVQKTAP